MRCEHSHSYNMYQLLLGLIFFFFYKYFNYYIVICIYVKNKQYS